MFDKKWEAKLKRQMKKAKPISASQLPWDESMKKALKDKGVLDVLRRLSDK